MSETLHSKERVQATTEVLRALTALSAAWRDRRYEDLAGFFADDMVFASPGFESRLVGGAAMVESYREFMERATLTAYEETNQTVDVWGDTAVASFRWEMSWLAGGAPNRAAGHDVFVFRCMGPTGIWRAVWRHRRHVSRRTL